MKARFLKKFEDEIQQLEKELKTELPQEIKRARELGDLRENAEYQAAKERQRLVESRISLLKKRVSEISLMNLDKLPRDKVGFGSTVHLKDPNGQVTVYQLVMPEDANVEDGLISTASPIGRALLNKEEGDEVTVSTPNGVEVGRWTTSLKFLFPLTGPVIVLILLLLVLPQIIGALAYLTLFFRVEERTQKYRILLVSLSLLIWFGMALVAAAIGIGEEDWWQVASRALGLGAALVILMAYRPPGFIQRRLAVASIMDESD